MAEQHWMVDELSLDIVVKMVDMARDRMDEGVLTPVEAVEQINSRLGLFIRFGAVDGTDLELVIEYARVCVTEIANHPDVMDPVLVEHFEQWVTEAPLARELEIKLDALLERVEVAAAAGDEDTLHELVELCRHGRRDQQILLRLAGTAERILREAHRLGVAEALVGAVSPRFGYDGQIACIYDTERSQLALNLLAHLAADPWRGAAARAGLLELTGYVETAGEAAIRLPMHLLDDADRARLVELYEQRVEVFNSDELAIPHGLATLRDSRVIRTALWQAHDARHML